MKSHDTITPEQIKHLGTLSRLFLTDQEITSFAPEIESIVSAVDKLKEIKEVTHAATFATALTNVAFVDDATNARGLTQDQAVSNATKSKDGLFQVPAVLSSK